MLQAEGFVIVEGTSPQSSAAQPGVPPGVLTGPDDEIAWETVEAAAPAAEASPSDAAAGDTLAMNCTAENTRVCAFNVLSVLDMCQTMLLVLGFSGTWLPAAVEQSFYCVCHLLQFIHCLSAWLALALACRPKLCLQAAYCTTGPGHSGSSLQEPL